MTEEDDLPDAPEDEEAEHTQGYDTKLLLAETGRTTRMKARRSVLPLLGDAEEGQSEDNTGKYDLRSQTIMPGDAPDAATKSPPPPILSGGPISALPIAGNAPLGAATLAAVTAAAASSNAGNGGATAAPAPIPTVETTEGEPHFSLADLWPDAHRQNARMAEALLASGDAADAILACDVLLTRILASAAVVAGSADAQRVPALVALLLGLDRGRYLEFRAKVRIAREQKPVALRDALECYLVAVDACRAYSRL